MTNFEIKKRYAFSCFYCGVQKNPESLQIDHIIPTIKGGSNCVENKVPACAKCNGTKCAHTLEEYQNLTIRRFEEHSALAKYHGKVLVKLNLILDNSK